mmetsp:Transcript_12498/g.12258  ORF Transcript_12498/g.12258 Transcript_12498/m.12258 type:complete len:165 (+) Transcript_12498:394-888(+)
MTEKLGGSDVQNSTKTIAIEDENKQRCSLYGYKWFTSAVDSDMALTLARFPANDQELEENTGKLALVYLKVRTSKKSLNNIEIVKLKDKLGTKPLPTAELVLNGTEARRISDVGMGVKCIGHMLNITRIHTGISAISFMRKIISAAHDYSEKREAFGKTLDGHP